MQLWAQRECEILAESKVKGVYKRKDGRWEARYVKGYSEDGRTLYGAVYGYSQEEVIQKRSELFASEDESEKAVSMNLLILGAGSHGHSVKEIAEHLRVFQKISFLDDNVTGEDIIGKCEDVMKFKEEYPCAFVAIGDNALRKKYAELLKKFSFLIPNIISPAATISSDAKIGEGVAIMPQSTISYAEIGDHCILASNSLVNYGAKMGSYSRIDSGAIVRKGTEMPEGTLLKDGEIL